jgi:hypothetical protein
MNDDESNDPMGRLQQLHNLLQQAVGMKVKVNDAIDKIVTTVVISLHTEVPALAVEAICNRFAQQHPHATIAVHEYPERGKKRKITQAKVKIYDNDGDIVKGKDYDITAFLVRAQCESNNPPPPDMSFDIYKKTTVAPDVTAQSMFKETMNRPGTGLSDEEELRRLVADLDIPFDFGQGND